MAYSMTGYGRGEHEGRGIRFTVEVKSVNHRYCDFNIKTPRGMSCFENRLRQLASKFIARGKVDIYVSYEEYGTGSSIIKVDESLADAYYHALILLQKKYELDGRIPLVSFAQIQGIMNVEKKEADEEMMWEVLGTASVHALEALRVMRGKEGAELVGDIRGRLSEMLVNLSEIENRAPAVVLEYKDRLLARIKELTEQQDVDFDEGRLAMEVAIFADRADIDEEIVRLKSHIDQAEKCLAIDEPIGRKLDFIVQEMNREINTIGSKSNDLDINKYVVDIKSGIEKIREQVQNLE